MSIFTKLTAFVTFAVIVTATLAHYIAFRFAKERITQRIHDHLATVAHDRAARLISFVSQQHERAALVATRTRLRYHLRKHVQKELDPEFRSATTRILNDASNATKEFEHIRIADKSGRIIAASHEQLLSVSTELSTDPDFQAGKLGPHLGIPFYSKKDDCYLAHLATPATSENKFLGVVIVTLRMTGLREILHDDVGLGRTGEVLVATENSQGELTFLMPPLRNQTLLSVSKSVARPMVRAIANRESPNEPQLYDGVPTLVVTRGIAYQSPQYRAWGMVVKIDAAEAYAPINNLLINQLILGGILVALSVAGTLVVARRVTRPILSIAKTASTIAEGDLKVRVPVERSDEIGTLAFAFNQMTENLAESHATLEQRVADRTQELAEANALLEQSNTDLQQYAHIASHDLQAPIRGIVGFAQFLQQDYAGKLDEQADDYIEQIVTSSLRMQNLVYDLLTYSKVESREAPSQPCDLNECYENAVAAIHDFITETGAQLSTDELPTVVGDEGQLSQLLQNLLTNGIKYNTSDKPVVTVTAHDHESGMVQISVKDNGIGISEKHQQHVFEIFRRLHTQEEYTGTGIGLAVCRRIVQRHGGEIWVEAAAEQGSRFCFTLPRA